MTFEDARNKMTLESVKSLPTITVVVPVYNLADYVTDTVESVLSQSYSGNLSILMLDDGSTDDSLAIAKKLAAKNNTITVHTQKNQGRAKTRNRLLELAETELIGWIDGDDIASPLWIEEQVALSVKPPRMRSGRWPRICDDGQPSCHESYRTPSVTS